MKEVTIGFHIKAARMYTYARVMAADADLVPGVKLLGRYEKFLQQGPLFQVLMAAVAELLPVQSCWAGAPKLMTAGMILCNACV